MQLVIQLTAVVRSALRRNYQVFVV